MFTSQRFTSRPVELEMNRVKNRAKLESGLYEAECHQKKVLGKFSSGIFLWPKIQDGRQNKMEVASCKAQHHYGRPME